MIAFKHAMLIEAQINQANQQPTNQPSLSIFASFETNAHARREFISDMRTNIGPTNNGDDAGTYCPGNMMDTGTYRPSPLISLLLLLHREAMNGHKTTQ